MKCRKLENGKWECYEEGPRDPVTNKRNAVRKQAKSKALAQQKVKAALKDLDSGVNGKKANYILFRDFAKEWFEHYKLTGVKNNTLVSRTSSLNLINTYIGDLSIGRITHQVVQDVITDLFKKGASKSTIAHAKVTMNFVFLHARKQRLRLDNPVEYTIIPKRRSTVEEIENTEIHEKFFDRAELEQFLNAAKHHGLIYDLEVFLLLAGTGMRIGELCALKWSDVSFDEKKLRITKTMENIDAYRNYMVTPPKTLNSVRTIDIDDQLIALIKRVKRIQTEQVLKYRLNNPDYHDENFVFARPKNGYPYTPRSFYRRCIRLCKKAGLAKIEGPHIFRHTHVTMLSEAGVELHIIMQRVGHVNALTTRNIYTHVSERKKKEASDLLEIQYGEIFKAYSEG